QFFGQPQVVRIEERHPVAAHVPEARAAGRGQIAAVLEPDRPHARILDRFEVIARAVGRTVIHDDELEIAMRLREDRIDRPEQKRQAIPGRKDDGNLRLPHGQWPPRFAWRPSLRTPDPPPYRNFCPLPVPRLPAPCAPHTSCPSAAPCESAR